MFKLILSLSILFLGVFIVGCSDNDSMMSSATEDQFSISPSNDAVAVRLDQKIEINFAKPMDRSIVESNFHLISQKDMADSTCPMSNSMLHSDMNMAMMDSMKMEHLTAFHYTKGKFIWNSENTQLLFTPDSMMQPNMIYMVHFGSDMINMMNERMSGMGPRGMNMDNMKSGMMMMHFTTMDTTGGGGNGHDGHH